MSIYVKDNKYLFHYLSCSSWVPESVNSFAIYVNVLVDYMKMDVDFKVQMTKIFLPYGSLKKVFHFENELVNHLSSCDKM